MTKVIIESMPDDEHRGFTARIPDIPAYGEGDTEEEVIADLKEAVSGFIEAFGIDAALSRVSNSRFREAEWDFAEIVNA